MNELQTAKVDEIRKKNRNESNMMKNLSLGISLQRSNAAIRRQTLKEASHEMAELISILFAEA